MSWKENDCHQGWDGETRGLGKRYPQQILGLLRCLESLATVWPNWHSIYLGVCQAWLWVYNKCSSIVWIGCTWLGSFFRPGAMRMPRKRSEVEYNLYAQNKNALNAKCPTTGPRGKWFGPGLCCTGTKYHCTKCGIWPCQQRESFATTTAILQLTSPH